MTDSRFFFEASLSVIGSWFSLLDPGLHWWLGLGLDICDDVVDIEDDDEDAIDGDDVIDSVGEKTADVEHDAWLEMRRFLSIGDDGRMRGGRGEN